jgi:hypothetical protein
MIDCPELKLRARGRRLSEIVDGVVSVKGDVRGNHSKREKLWLRDLGKGSFFAKRCGGFGSVEVEILAITCDFPMTINHSKSSHQML